MQDYGAYKHLVCERPEAGILKITINNPESLNAIAPPIHSELAHIWVDVAADEETRVVLLTGAGRAFSAGGDVHNMRATWRQRDIAHTMREGKQIVDRILDLPQPLIALINGHAVGLGATLALCCDIVFAAEGAKIGDRHVNVGLVAGDGGALLWPLLLGPHRAKQFLMTGELIEGREAAAMGLINKAVPAEQLEAEGLAFARTLAALPPLAVQWTKLSVNKTLKLIANAAFETSLAYEGASMLSQDHLEAVSAFIEHRAPSFSGR
ncbi:MAG TPA: enoyl-CoA hydratase-related protein [Dehalococcoidia bacterium]|nr:enoyl-CoA hydratase-related protein [Dehalococcoidia bacterium]